MVLTLRYFNEFVTPAVELITAFSCIELIDRVNFYNTSGGEVSVRN